MHKPNNFDPMSGFNSSSSNPHHPQAAALPSELPPISPASTPSGPSDSKQATPPSAAAAGAPPPPPPASSPYSPYSSSPFSSPASSVHKEPLELLPPDYEPGHWDVICQRGKTCDDHIGNRRFRLCVENHVQAYINARNRQAKSDVISAVVRSIRRSTGKKGGFVMKVRIRKKNRFQTGKET
jgi:hypothetical protein